MSKLGVIMDGISRDLEHALQVLTEAGLKYAELQFVWDAEVGDHTDEQISKIKELITKYDVQVSCISRHIFGGVFLMGTEIGDETYNFHMEKLKRCILMAKELNTDLVRIMSFRKEMILFGSNGAEQWVVTGGAWDKFLEILEEPVRLAEKEGVTLVVETGNNAMITTAVLGRKMIDAIGSDNLKILWDPANSLYANEQTFPDGYEYLKGGFLGHLHIKDVKGNIPAATVSMCPLGTGDMVPYLEPLGNALKEDGYQGVISLESVYHPDNGTYEDGFKASLAEFKRLFG